MSIIRFHGLKRAARAAVALVTLTMAALPQVQAAGVPGQGTWETTLQGRDLDGNAATFEAFYDTALNITWLADANFAKTSGYDADGEMNWNQAKTWADNLVFGGYSDWRLPTLVDTGTAGGNWSTSGTDFGFNVNTSTSEMAHMFHVTLGNKAYYDTLGNGPQSGWGLTNTGSFSNLFGYYWFGLEYATSTNYAWFFDMNTGGQNAFPMSYSRYHSWAVRSGDVAAVPEPAGYAIALTGLAALLVARARRQR